MSPFLESEVFPKETLKVKFVRVGGKIYFSDSEDMMGIVFEKHSVLAQKAGVTEQDDEDRPIVDDAGYMANHNGKFEFSESSMTCAIKSSTNRREETYSIAKDILGKDRVA